MPITKKRSARLPKPSSMHQQGFSTVRVRYFNETARIEIEHQPDAEVVGLEGRNRGLF